MFKYKSSIVLGAVLLVGTVGCTNLDDKILDAISSDKPAGAAGGAQINPADLLKANYADLNDLTDQGNTYALEEHSTDEMMGPTRGTDWDDFGTWRKLHQHTWNSTHNQVSNTWDNLNSRIFRATQTITATGATNQIKAEASFLRAFFMFFVVDLYGQVPFREVTDDAEANPKVFTRSEAADFIIKDLEFALTNLAAGAPAGKASKEAAQFLLAKVYLNKAVFKQAPATPAGPFSHVKADMDKVIEYVNAITASGKFALQPKGKYFDNFHWENDTRSKELIFVISNVSGSPVGNVRNRYYMTMHYNQRPSAWNGFTTLADFYNSFEAGDERIGGPIAGVTDSLGIRSGFLVGQQFGPGNVPLKTRGGQPLVFTKDININYATEEKGIRVIKYFPQPGNLDNPGTDYVFFRYADALLMKAEAIFRTGTDPRGETAAKLVGDLRAARGASAIASVTEPVLLAERGRELYWEGWRRNDQIRFGKFLDPVDQRAQKSADHVVVFPIPQRAIDSNPNLKQNTGY